MYYKWHVHLLWTISLPHSKFGQPPNKTPTKSKLRSGNQGQQHVLIYVYETGARSA